MDMQLILGMQTKGIRFFLTFFVLVISVCMLPRMCTCEYNQVDVHYNHSLQFSYCACPIQIVKILRTMAKKEMGKRKEKRDVRVGFTSLARSFRQLIYFNPLLI